MASFGKDVTDLVVVVPGILGSRLATVRGEVWGTSVRTLLTNVVTFGRRLGQTLTIPADVDPDDPGDGVHATGLITGMTVLPGFLAMDYYDGLQRALRTDLALADGQLVTFPYDWRLSCRINGARLAEFLDQHLETYRTRRPDARAILICHSMGGLVARWCVEACGGDALVSTLITIGTPHQGAALALDGVVNGVRLPRRLGVDLSTMARSFPSVYELLPTYDVVRHRGTMAPLSDGELAERIASLCPDGTAATRIERGLSFHRDLTDLVTARTTSPSHELMAFRGAEQPTLVYADLGTEGLRAVESFDDNRRGGDGVVPDESAVPPEWTSTLAARSASGKHSSMANGAGVREELRVALRHRGRTMAPPIELTTRAPTELAAGHQLVVEIAASRPDTELPELAISVVPIEVADTATTRTVLARQRGGQQIATIDGLAPGLYRLRVHSSEQLVDAVEDALLVHEAEE